ncbi:MAG: hypothetical protein WAT38_09975, partial [Nitrospira sp.]
MAVKSFWELNTEKLLGKEGLMLPKRTGVAEPEFALTLNADPGVSNTAPRAELELKKFPGRLLGSENPAGTP